MYPDDLIKQIIIQFLQRGKYEIYSKLTERSMSLDFRGATMSPETLIQFIKVRQRFYAPQTDVSPTDQQGTPGEKKTPEGLTSSDPIKSDVVSRKQQAKEKKTK